MNAKQHTGVPSGSPPILCTDHRQDGLNAATPAIRRPAARQLVHARSSHPSRPTETIALAAQAADVARALATIPIAHTTGPASGSGRASGPTRRPPAWRVKQGVMVSRCSPDRAGQRGAPPIRAKHVSTEQRRTQTRIRILRGSGIVRAVPNAPALHSRIRGSRRRRPRRATSGGRSGPRRWRGGGRDPNYSRTPALLIARYFRYAVEGQSGDQRSGVLPLVLWGRERTCRFGRHQGVQIAHIGAVSWRRRYRAGLPQT